MFILGPIGVYFLALTLMGGERSSAKKSAAFLAGMFYIFNLSTVQLFFSNFDGFISHYGFIPWLFMFSYKFITQGQRKDIVLFIIFSILGANQAYTGTLFFAFALSLSILVFFVSIQNRKTVPFKRLLTFIALWFGVNAFWILPVGYFIKTSSGVVSKASINLMSSEESYFMNRKYGTIGDVLTLKNFWFDLNDYSRETNDFVPLLEVWIDNINGKTILLYASALMVILGFFVSITTKKYRSISLLFLISVFFLMAGNGLFGNLFLFLQRSVPLFKEALRFPFTKFSVLASLMYSLMIFVLFEKIFDLIYSKTKKHLVVGGIVFFLSLIFMYTYKPYFKGYLLNPRMKLSVPQEYFSMYDFFNSQPSDGRAYLMPSNTFWAWEYNDWGYRGSGFIWYGMKQPVIARAFDVWNDENENVYWEMSEALFSKNTALLESVIRKYNIHWLIYDGSRVYPGNEPSEKLSAETKTYLDELLLSGDLIKEVHKFGFIEVYRTGVTDRLFSLSNSDIPTISTFDGLSSFDPAYFEFGDYISSKPKESQIIYPYSHLFGIRSLGGYENSSIMPFYGDVSLDQNKSVNFSIPYNELISVDNTGLNVTFDPVIRTIKTGGGHTIRRDLVLQESDSVILSGKHFIARDLKEKGSAGFIMPSNRISRLEIFRSISKYSLDDLMNSRPNLSTCSDVDLGSYLVEFKDNSLFLSSSKENPSVCVFADLSISSETNKLKVINFDFSSKNSVGRVCFLDNVTRKCVFSKNFFYPGNYSVPLTNIEDGKSYSIYFYGYPLSTESLFIDEYESNFLNIFVEDKELLYREDIDLSKEISGLLRGDSISFDVQTDIDGVYVYNEKDLPSLFRSCDKGGDRVNFSSESGGIVFNVPSDSGMCLTILNDSMLPYLPFSGIVEIDYDISDKSQNVYVVKNNFYSLIDKFSGSNMTGKLVFPINKADSLAVNVELTSPGTEGNYLKITSIKVIPFDIEKAILSKVYLNEDRGEKPLIEEVDYKGTHFVYKVNDVKNGALVFRQSYSKGWVLLCGNIFCESDHLKMNNWSNIWTLKNSTSVAYVFFLPQILGFIGFFLSVFSLIYALFLIDRKRRE